MATNAYTHDPRIEESLLVLDQASADARQVLERFKAEVSFCAGMARNNPDKREEWLTLVQQAVGQVNAAIAGDGNVAQAVRAAEAALSPLATAAKQYTIHCVGHGHIDMDWMWNWPETVATTNDTFTTVDRLMNEFPDFHYSQSQASVYQIMKDYLPELYEKVKQRVAEGRWEVTANHWVEGDKNLASGEILCRHILYTKRFFKQEFGLPYDAVSIDWEPDTFGHAHTLPTILSKGGVRRYYLHRAGPGPMLFWWQGKDGARVMVFDDRLRGYNGQINGQIINHLFDFEQATGLKDFLFVYGVGDHGGGPTRRDLQNAVRMAEWPLFPNIKLSTTEAFFSIAEREARNLPVIDAEMNYVFEGCYTAQSNIKRANRKSENMLVSTEAVALLAKGLAGLAYPEHDLALAWRHAMFNQFHDILPGSGVHATYEYSQGLFQEILARTSMIKTRSLRKLAGMVDVSALAKSSRPIGLHAGFDVGGGPGDVTGEGGLSRRGAGGGVSDPFVIFNPSAWQRTELVTARLWDRIYPDQQISVTDDDGNVYPAQVTERGNYWGHNYIGVAFVAEGVPGTGWRTYNVAHDVAISNAGGPSGCFGDGKGTLENEYLKVVVEQPSGAISHLIDKRTGIDMVSPGKRLGLLEYFLEAPHPMTAWVIGQIKAYQPFTEGGVIDCPANGPYLTSVRAKHTLNDSQFTLTISLAAGVPRVDFALDVNWLERGAPEVGVPMLRVAFPLALKDGVATCECPNGHVRRSTDPRELSSYTSWLGGTYWPTSEAVDATPGDVPAQKWADLSGQTDAAQPFGATILNDSKYGYYVDGDTIRLTLLRSSYDPDPLPELGQHTIRFAIQPHDGTCTPADATRAGYAFNNPFEVVGTDVHSGTLPTHAGHVDVLTPNVILSGLKKAEDSDALIVRLYEANGQAATARVRLADALCAANAPAVETDLVEQPLAQSSARVQDGVLSVDLPAFGLVTVKIG
jgi:alpha-mannosidase